MKLKNPYLEEKMHSHSKVASDIKTKSQNNNNNNHSNTMTLKLLKTITNYPDCIWVIKNELEKENGKQNQWQYITNTYQSSQ